MALPSGHELKAGGFSSEDKQLIELQKFCVEQIARIYSLPPVFLQDLSTGTFSNVEQQDIHYVKHTLRRWIEQTEQEMPVRTIQEAELYDVNIFTTPAYSGTEIGLRSLETHRKTNRKSQAPRRMRMKARLRR